MRQCMLPSIHVLGRFSFVDDAPIMLLMIQTHILTCCISPTR